MHAVIASLHIHPVKSLKAQTVTEAAVTPLGLAGDRRWMLVDATGRFITQREDGRLAQISATPTPVGLELAIPGQPAVSIQIPGPDAPRMPAVVWAHSLPLPLVEAPQLGAFLGYPVRLAYLPEDVQRCSNPDWAGPDAPVSLADAYAVLIATTGSLAALNAVIEGPPVPMDRFRPNIVIDAPAWAETRWRRIRIGDVELELVKPSDRCIVTTTDQASGARMGKEPLASLARIRRSADKRINGVLFGENAVVRQTGTVRVGDAVTLLDSGPAFPVAGAIPAA